MHYRHRATYGVMQHMGSCNIWGHATYGVMQHMGSCNIWGHETYGVMQHMGSCNLWGRNARYGLADTRSIITL